MNFEELYLKVEESSHETAFNKEECEALYDLLYTLPERSTVLEIGIEFGRSTTVFAEICKERGFDFHACDAWVGEYSPQAYRHVLEQIRKYDWKLTLYSMLSQELRQAFNMELDLLHIDGDHTFAGVMTDMQLFMPLVKSGGYVAFDDYGHDSLPEVYTAVSAYMDNGGYEFVGRYGNKLGVFKKL